MHKTVLARPKRDRNDRRHGFIPRYMQNAAIAMNAAFLPNLLHLPAINRRHEAAVAGPIATA